MVGSQCPAASTPCRLRGDSRRAKLLGPRHVCIPMCRGAAEWVGGLMHKPAGVLRTDDVHVHTRSRQCLV